jgi:uncharacterized membrane protein
MQPLRIEATWKRLSSTLWFVPALVTVASIGLAFASLWFDRTFVGRERGWFFLYSGGPEGARSVLSTTAGSMITVAGIAFSTTMVALSFASSQLGPRLLGNFMKDRSNQVVLGTFIGTFVYCMLVLRTVSSEPPFVPHFGVTAGLGMALASLVVLIYFIHHVARTLQADYVIALVGRELDHSIRHMYPGGMGHDAPEAELAAFRAQEDELRSEEAAVACLAVSGYVHALDLRSVMRIATRHDLVIRILSRPGRYVHDATPVAEIWPRSRANERVRRQVAKAFIMGRTRTSEQDVEYALNQLVEVAVRALSAAVNDPFTAITCIDRLSTALLHLMRRDFPPPFRVDDAGKLRVIAERADFPGIVDAAIHQIRQAGAAIPAVMIYLLESLEVLLEEARTEEHRRALRHHVELVRRASLREAEEPEDRSDVIRRADEAETVARE